MDDDHRWLLAGLITLILCGVAGAWTFRLLRRRAAARRAADAEATTRIEAVERFEAEQEAEAISMREAADRQRAAEIAAEAAQRRAEDDERERRDRVAAEAEAEALRLAEVAQAKFEAAQAQADAARRLAEAAARRAEAERLAAEVAARENAEREQAAARAEAARLEAERIERIERERAAEAARLEQQRLLAVEQARVEQQRIAEAAEAAEAEARLEAERAMARAASGPRSPEDTLVLVADDSKIVRVKTGRLLAQHRFRVAFAVDGADAVRLLAEERPHVLITDVEMPEIDGFELTRRLRADPRTADIPVIMITAADDKHRAHATEVGVDVLLGKPYPEEELVDHIRRVMNLDELQRRAEV